MSVSNLIQARNCAPIPDVMTTEKKELKVKVSLLHSRTDFGYYSIVLHNKVQ